MESESTFGMHGHNSALSRELEFPGLLVDGAYETDELPFVMKADSSVTPPPNANGRAPGDLT